MARGLLWTIGLVLLGCTAEVPRGGEEVGALALRLQQTTAEGETFRLREATIEITGTAAHTLEPSPDEATLQLELPVGAYALRLAPGFVLERRAAAGWVEAPARLSSENPQAFEISAGAVTTIALRFTLDVMVTVQPGTLEVQLAVEPAAGGGAGCTPRLVINELDYDQEGTDIADFVELFAADGCAVETAGHVLALVNGGAAGAPSYATVDLTQLGPRIEAGEHVVIADTTVGASLPTGARFIGVGGFSIQNGSPDGLRLERDGEVLDGLSYGGAIDGTTEAQSAPADRGAGSLGRCPDGEDGDDNAQDFAFHAMPTPGAPNACP